MKGTGMTKYTFTISGSVKIDLPGNDTEENCEEAKKQAIQMAIKEIDDDWIDDVDAEEYTDYEEFEERSEV
jgi:biopolymer transport protein ExbD